MLDSLRELQSTSSQHDPNEDNPAPFSCIIASSGTGKSQLAATAAMSKEYSTKYLYTGTQNQEGLQKFYKPHLRLWVQLLSFVREFKSMARSNKFMVFSSGNTTSRLGAGSILMTAKDLTYGSFTCDLFLLLDRILFDTKTTGVTLAQLRNKLAASKTLMLVFLDEVPGKESTDAFEEVVLLRDVLRAIGICPILMSTHSGAQNAVPTGNNSRNSADGPSWCRVFSRLPRYHNTQEILGQNKWLWKSERPLVASLMVDHPEKDNLSAIVTMVMNNMQQRKVQAWKDKPVFQLCQLFRTKADEDVKASDSHELVGKHFGRLVVDNIDSGNPIDVERAAADSWLAGRTVRMVEVEVEPVLFLALTTWKMDYIQANSIPLFPLVNKVGAAISVREAFNTSPAFSPRVNVRNSHARHLEGDDLEVVALASITLASLRSETSIFCGVLLPQFIATVYHLMLPGNLKVTEMENTESQVSKLLPLEFKEVTVPASPCSESSFGDWLVRRNNTLTTGMLKRPPNSEKRDGYLETTSKEAIIHIECKNLKNKFKTTVMKAVMERMRVKTAVSFFFTSDLGSLFVENDSYTNYTEELDSEGNICILVLAAGKPPHWLLVENGTVKVEPKETTTHLAVIFATGTVANATV
jgi:hypothetical protein